MEALPSFVDEHMQKHGSLREIESNAWNMEQAATLLPSGVTKLGFFSRQNTHLLKDPDELEKSADLAFDFFSG